MLRLSEHIKERKNFESLGLGKNKLRKLSCLIPFFEQCGRVKISSEDYSAYQVKNKEREAILAKNNKLRALKKAEEPVPYLDPVEQDSETGDWYMMQYSTLRHFNLMENGFQDDDDCLEELIQLIDRCSNLAIVLN